MLEVCPEFARFSADADGMRKSFEGSSLETIKHMVASGMGITVVPILSVPKESHEHVTYIAFEPPVKLVSVQPDVLPPPSSNDPLRTAFEPTCSSVELMPSWL